jgi:ribosomal protein L23
MENIIIKPILTEKMAELGEKLNRYAFEVKLMPIRFRLKTLLKMLMV